VADHSTSLNLLDKVVDRDLAAWYRLSYLYTPLVNHWCQAWGVHGPDAEAIRKEAFRAVAEALPQFRRERPGDSFRAWLRALVRATCLDFYRRQRPASAPSGNTPQPQPFQLDGAEERGADDPPVEIRRLHHRALDLVRGEFEQRTWQAFWRCAVDGVAPADVGREMEMTPTAVRYAKARVLRRLKAEFEELLT
jgi:RNA polymerase sigma-70 factor (ECF subfamily)